MTMSFPEWTDAKDSAQTAFSRRRTVLRTTAEPTWRLTMKPNRGVDASDGFT